MPKSFSISNGAANIAVPVSAVRWAARRITGSAWTRQPHGSSPAKGLFSRVFLPLDHCQPKAAESPSTLARRAHVGAPRLFNSSRLPCSYRRQTKGDEHSQKPFTLGRWYQQQQLCSHYVDGQSCVRDIYSAGKNQVAKKTTEMLRIPGTKSALRHPGQ